MRAEALNLGSNFLDDNNHADGTHDKAKYHDDNILGQTEARCCVASQTEMKHTGQDEGQRCTAYCTYSQPGKIRKMHQFNSTSN